MLFINHNITYKSTYIASFACTCTRYTCASANAHAST